MALSKLRSASYIEGVGLETEDFSNQLPTVRDVLCVFFYELRGKHVVRNAARHTMKKVAVLWDTTTIPRIQEIRGIEKIEATYHTLRGINRHKNDRRLTEAGVERKRAFECELNSLFDLAKSDAIQEMQQQAMAVKTDTEKFALEEDILFLEDQRGPRLRYVGDTDKKLKAHVIDKCRKENEREEKLKRRREAALKEKQRLEAEKQKFGELHCPLLYVTIRQL